MTALEFAQRDTARLDRLIFDLFDDGWKMWHWWDVEQPTKEDEVMMIGMMTFWRKKRDI